jgi:hypothetical protein
MRTADQLFADDNGWRSFHDAVLEVDGKERSKEELRPIFDALPEPIRDTAHQWGLGDTVFRDAAYSHLKKKGISS